MNEINLNTNVQQQAQKQEPIAETAGTIASAQTTNTGSPLFNAVAETAGTIASSSGSSSSSSSSSSSGGGSTSFVC